MADIRARRIGLLALWIVFGVLLVAVGGAAAAYLNHRSEVERARASLAGELEQAREDLDTSNAWLVDAQARRSTVQIRYAYEEARAARDAACFQHIQEKLNEMKRASRVSVQYGHCVEAE